MKPKSPATKTPHKDMPTLEPCNSRQGNMVVVKMGASEKTGADMDKVLEHIERIQDLGVCS
jgi:hypothetical protein